MPNLGPHPRLPWRVGKRVTQQEVAEAVGISREWYATLESATTIEASNRPSQRVLERLAEVLMITPQQRATLFEMVV
ncbi:MAG TPA: helix-turn-helix transcriptional regulator, partial [Candidatus Acidoferrum sp.]|nr:helix-turn-helix transcriptional regulator [Candidatus Acidoferrum sp.]